MPLSEDIKSKKEDQYGNALIAGVTSGLVASYASFIFAATKKRKQSGQASPSISKLGFYFWFREILRGSVNYSCLLAPTAVVQQTADEYLKNHLPDGKISQTLGVLFSGALGGVVSTVAENILLRQQLEKISAAQAAKKLFHESYTRLFCGLWLIMMREAIFGFCYLRGVKQVGEYTKENMGNAYVMPLQIIFGIACSLFSHPLDTMATTMQHKNYKHIHQAFSHLLKQPAPFEAFFLGASSRAKLFVTSAMVTSYVQDAVMSKLQAAH